MSTCGQCGSGTGPFFDGADFSGDDVVCAPCAEGLMAHGHRHSHDEPEDCSAVLPALGGGKPLTLTC